MGVKQHVRHGARMISWPASAALARLRQHSRRPTRFAGAWPTRAAALASLPDTAKAGYDDPSVAEVSFEFMAQVASTDYPVLFWMHRILKPGDRVLDAGGHLGTKYLAWRDHLDLAQIAWTVQDLPGIVQAARAAQAEGRVPSAVTFVETAQGVAADVLLASGLLQYLDRPLGDVVAEMAAPPRQIVLNKVATRKGPGVVTLERIGPARVPYQIRNRTQFEDSLNGFGYRVADSWDLPELSHVIPTHPWLGPSLSRGYLLERAE